MRSTFRIDRDLLEDLRARARREKVSLTSLVNRVLRRGLQAPPGGKARRRRYREETYAMGAPRVDLRKALALAATLEDDEVRRKLALRK
jgi:hypothetical protein